VAGERSPHGTHAAGARAASQAFFFRIDARESKPAK
jgi:hypothetical protein